MSAKKSVEETPPVVETPVSPTHTTISGRPIAPLYRREDVADLDYTRDLGDPGDFPFTRGVHRTMYRGKVWSMRQFAGFGTPRETNARFKYLLEHGSHGLSVAVTTALPDRKASSVTKP